MLAGYQQYQHEVKNRDREEKGREERNKEEISRKSITGENTGKLREIQACRFNP